MIFSINMLFLFLVALLKSSIGFKKYVWFISLGYGFSITGEGLFMLILYRNELSIAGLLCCILFILYGIRLGGYLAYREAKATSYKNNMKGEIKENKDVSLGAKFAIWITCAILYLAQISPVHYRLENGAASNPMVYVSIGIMALGLIIETLADLQKNAAKKKNARRFVDSGLYRIVRCPNYFGEILFWTGTFLSGIGAVSGIGQWIITSLGYLGIVYVMFGGARRLEIRQNKNYGSDPEYQKYVKTVPIIIPLIPLYSVEKQKWLVG